MVEKNKNAYKSISEVAEILQLVNTKTGLLNTYTLRFWEKEFRQIKPKLFAGRRRYYDHKTIETIKKIKYLLKDKGMTIDGVKKHLNSENSNLDDFDNTSINKKKILKSRINKISRIIKDLKK